MNSIVLTGATSMIGTAIVKEALLSDKNVVAIVRKNSTKSDYLRSLKNSHNLEIVECDIHEYGTLDLNVQSDAFLHLAWQNTDSSARDDVYTHVKNIKYTLDAINAAHRAGCKVFVSVGSQAEYGRASGKLCGNTACDPESGYGIAKYAAGKMARLAAARYDMRHCHTRVLSTYGEGMGETSLIIYLIKSLLCGKKPTLTKCEQMWDFMYVQDTARALLAVTENGVDGKTYPIGSAIAKPLREYVELIRDIVDPSIGLGFGEREYYPHQPMYLCADISELSADTGFKPGISFEDGISKTIEWVKSGIFGYF